MAALTPGRIVDLPDTPGRWSVWSPSDETPGAHFFVLANDEARETGIKYIVARVIYPRTAPKPVITILRVEKYYY